MDNEHDPRRRCLMKFLCATAIAPIPTLYASDEQPLLYRKIPKADQSLPVVGVGTSRVFDVGDDAAQRAGPRDVLKVLAKTQHAMLDTSPMYGSAEQVAGDLTAELGVRERLFFATKVWTNGREAGIEQMNTSFKRLQTDRIDLMQIHNLVDWQTHLDTLHEWQDQGRIRHIGITHYTQGAYDALEAVMRAVPLDFVQLNYSLAEPHAAERLLPLAQEKGIAIIVNRPFARGQLFRKTRGHELPAWSREFDCQSWAQFFLKWIIGHPAVTVAIPGTSKAKHMLDNMEAARGRLPGPKTRQRMQALINQL